MALYTELYPIHADFPGVLSISARPRGGEWLEDEICGWRNAGVEHVVSLLTSDEEADLDLVEERRLCKKAGIRFTNLPIEDRGVPGSDAQAAVLIDSLRADLLRGTSVVVHCRQGVGRAATIAAGVLVENGWPVERAIAEISQDRGVLVPETREQRDWIERFALMESIRSQHRR